MQVLLSDSESDELCAAIAPGRSEASAACILPSPSETTRGGGSAGGSEPENPDTARKTPGASRGPGSAAPSSKVVRAEPYSWNQDLGVERVTPALLASFKHSVLRALAARDSADRALVEAEKQFRGFATSAADPGASSSASAQAQAGGVASAGLQRATATGSADGDAGAGEAASVPAATELRLTSAVCSTSAREWRQRRRRRADRDCDPPIAHSFAEREPSPQLHSLRGKRRGGKTEESRRRRTRRRGARSSRSSSSASSSPASPTPSCAVTTARRRENNAICPGSVAPGGHDSNNDTTIITDNDDTNTNTNTGTARGEAESPSASVSIANSNNVASLWTEKYSPREVLYSCVCASVSVCLCVCVGTYLRSACSQY
jgi:hypothetical protein